MADDLGAVFDAHVASEFVARDVGATMATMTDDPYVNHVPTMMGGVGREQVASFYERHFIAGRADRSQHAAGDRRGTGRQDPRQGPARQPATRPRFMTSARSLARRSPAS